MVVLAASALPTDPIEALQELTRSGVELDRLRRSYVQAARAKGVSWEKIGEALAMTKQGAWEYFTRDALTALRRNVDSNVELGEEEAMEMAVAEVKAIRSQRRAQ